MPPALLRSQARYRRRRLGLGADSRIFGIGLSRTGTTSLTVALSMLSYRAIHLPTDAQSRRELLAFVQTQPPAIRMAVLDVFDAVTDTPACVMFEALDRAYPGSRFILTTREKEPWLDSCRRHWATVMRRFAEPRDDPESRYIQALSRSLYGTTEFDADRFADAYDAYHRRVADYFAGRPDDLLRADFAAGDGWGALCAFLGRPRPDSEFPRANAAGTAA